LVLTFVTEPSSILLALMMFALAARWLRTR